MLTSVTVEHFKGFDPRISAELAPLTLIFGANSTGKSSFLQSLLILKQTASPSNTSRAPLSFAGPTFDFGSYRNIVFRHDTKSSVSIGLGFTYTPEANAAYLQPTFDKGTYYVNYFYSVDEARRVLMPRFTVSSEADRAEFTFENWENPSLASPLQPGFSRTYRTYRLTQIAPDSPIAAKYFANFMQGDRERFLQMINNARTHFVAVLSSQLQAAAQRRPTQVANPDFRAESERMISERIARLQDYDFSKYLEDCIDLAKGVVIAIDAISPFQVLTTSRIFAPDAFRLENYLGLRSPHVLDVTSLGFTCLQQLTTELKALTYVGPYRQSPRRVYIYQGDAPLNVGDHGENFADALYANQRYEDAVNRLCDLMELGFRVKVSTASEELTQAFAVTLLDRVLETEVPLNDVGFGVSQILPVLLQIAMTTENTLIVEEPELHLNPKLQATLGQVFAEAVREDPSRQIIVETHSEHLLLRLQRCIRDGVLTSDRVKVLYVSRDYFGSHIQELPLSEKGELIGGWPAGFFEEGFSELYPR